MRDLAEVAAELDGVHGIARAAFSRRDFGAYMSLFSPDLRYRQSDGKVIDRDRLRRDVQAQFCRLGAASSTFVREKIEFADGKAIEILCQTASARATAFFVLHRTWDISRRGRYVWRLDAGRWVIEDVEVLEEEIKSRGLSIRLRAPALV
jgi:hypothetical protein